MAGKSFTRALQRSLDVFKEETARVMRMETSPTSTSQGPLHLYSLTHPSHLNQFATGCDSDIGGLTTCKLALDDQEGKGRFFGTITNEVPRGAKIEKSGYAGMRNKVSHLLVLLLTFTKEMETESGNILISEN